jgi:hypothetical protein
LRSKLGEFQVARLERKVEANRARMNVERDRMAARELAVDAAIKEGSELQCKAFFELMIERGLGYFDDTGRFDLTPEGRNHMPTRPERTAFAEEIRRRWVFCRNCCR